MKVAINGGHYDDLDSGAIGASGLHEANVTYRLMELVSYYLQQVDYETLMIYENELYDITSASNNWGADLFISIHCNSAENRSAQGTETFAFLDGENGYKLADCIQNQIVNSMETVDRGVKTNGFYVLRNTNCPAVLVETAFISNEEDEKLLLDDSKLDEFAKAIARGVTDYVSNS